MSSPSEKSDASVVEALSRAHGVALVRYFHRRGIKGGDAEDAAQDVFVRLVRRGGLANIDQANAYLFQTAASVAADFFRRAHRTRSNAHISYDERLHAQEDFSPEQILREKEDLRLVMIGLRELPERTRTIFVLSRLEHMKQSEIARRLGISVAAVDKNMLKAVTHLAERLGRSK